MAEEGKVTRRDFLVGAGAGVVVTGVVAAGLSSLRDPEIEIREVPGETVEVEVPGETITETIEVEVPVEVEVIKEVEVPGPEVIVEVGTPLPATMRAVTLNIDGGSYDAIVDVRESLWETMTNKLGLGSRTSIGCDRAQCGACAVAIDGLSVNSCTLLSARLGRGQQILTVTGLTTGREMEDLHPIQTAFIENFGGQCSACSRGFIISTYALLLKNPSPTEAEVRVGLEGNICRCANYTKILDSAMASAG
jgi:carbon-monoxide dehydrogenase small subunit